MKDAFAKCHDWRDIELLAEVGIHPYYRALDARRGAVETMIAGRTVLMAGSNDYLALATDPRVTSAAAQAARRWGAGNSGSRLTNGSLALHEELEGRLADHLGHQSALITTTGYQANLSLGPLFGPNDTVVADRDAHASLLNAVRLGGARLQRFPHNDTGRLAALLDDVAPDRGRLVLTEGMFSVTGDLADLPGIAKAAGQHGARLVLDGAHDVGLLGRDGQGAAEHFGVQSAVDVQTLTFSKCFGTLGGAVAGPEEVIRYLRYHAQATLFSASLPASCTAAAMAALDIVREEPERRRRVLATGEHLARELSALGFTTGSGGMPTIPVHVGDLLLCLRFWTELFNEGVFTNAMVAPAVPDGKALVRVSVTAAHTERHVERIAEAFAAAGRRLGLIG